MEGWDGEDFDYEPDGPADGCDHEDYDADILTGRAMCYRCGHTWWQSAEEIEREIERLREYDRYIQEEQMRAHWWGRMWLAVRDFFRLTPGAPHDAS